MVYGPVDKPQVVVMNLGNEKHANVVVTVKDVKGKQVYKQTFRHVVLPAGRAAVSVGQLQLPNISDGYYFFDYHVYEKQEEELK